MTRIINWLKDKYEWFKEAESETRIGLIFTLAAFVMLVLFLTSYGSPSVDDSWLYKTL